MNVHDYKDPKILRPDVKGRIHLGTLTKGVSGYRVEINEKTHVITLKPYAEIPLEETWLFENKKALKSVKQGLQDSKTKKLVNRGSFNKYIKTEE